MYLIRLDSAAIWTRQERRREGNSKLGWGNLCFRRKWDLRDSYSHPPLPLLPPPQRPLEPPQPGHGRSPNRNIYRPLSRGRECKLYLYSISRGQINISTNQPCLPVFPAKLVFRKSLKSTSRVIRVSHFLQLHRPRSFPSSSFPRFSSSFEYLNIYQCMRVTKFSLLSIVRLKITITIWQRYYHRRSLDRLLRFDSICDWNAHSCSEELKYILSFLFFSPCFLLWQRLHNGWKRTS